MQSLFNVYKNWIVDKIIQLFFLYNQQRHFWNIVKHLWLAFFVKKSKQLKVVNYFCKKEQTTINFWFGSNYGSWQYCQQNGHLKDISPTM